MDFINATTNLTNKNYQMVNLSYHNFIFLTVNLLLAPFIIGGNFVVIRCIATFSRLHTVSNIFVSSLAVADLLVGLLVIPFYSMHYLELEGFAESKYTCLFKYVFIIASCGSSIFNLSAIAFERFVAVTYPFRYATLITHKTAKVMIALLWIYVSVLSLTPLFGLNTWRPDVHCDFYQVLPRAYIVWASFTTVSFGIVSITLFYILTYREIRKMPPPPMIQSKEAISQKKNIRATYVMCVVSVTFLVFWLPYLIAGPLVYIPSLNKHSIELIKNYALSLGISNSVINPFLYGCLRRDFAEVFRKYFSLPCLKRKRRSVGPGSNGSTENSFPLSEY
ncbi:adenosine receptor A2a [Octopus bimaculoides]|uniref:G-protein coupled receptors family 1 profile domain-containing protein n=1 Tax=Octopus bimaculoides TaxID=37653 RepID=A0A0L8HNX8_OCTBM|nr:adenosine receptor A2a [Octopus bimaculoides]|eukprot:XP_014771054.1 PREDICTED: adenosine receptor A2a-like [Octopus bimaculoides]